jgi:hypothetical protein
MNGLAIETVDSEAKDRQHRFESKRAVRHTRPGTSRHGIIGRNEVADHSEDAVATHNHAKEHENGAKAAFPI